MKTILFSIICVLIALNARGGQTVAVSAGDSLLIYEVQENGSLVEKQVTRFTGTAGTMGISPDQTKLYLNTKMPDDAKTAAIATLAIQKDGTVKQLHVAPAGWNSGYLRPDPSGKFLAGNTYRDGKVGIWKLDEDGIYRGDGSVEFELEKRAHSAVFSPDGRFLYVPATGPDKIFQLVLNKENGRVFPNQPSSTPTMLKAEVRQPRHIIFHPTLPFAYTTQEREMPGAGVWAFDSETGTLENIQTILSVDESDWEGMTTADLHLSNDGKFLYVSNRDIKNRKQPEGRDSIAVFQVNQENGELSFIERVVCERVPRSFAIGKDSNYLFVSGQGDNKLGVYQIDGETGQLTKIGKSIELPGAPTWVSVLVSE